jgi:hypothetical protein
VRTVIVHGRAVEQVAHELTQVEAATVVKVLAAEGIAVEPTEPDFFGVIHLWAKRPTDTAGEVRALRAFRAVTDQTLHWHGAGVAP